MQMKQSATNEKENKKGGCMGSITEANENCCQAVIRQPINLSLYYVFETENANYFFPTTP